MLPVGAQVTSMEITPYPADLSERELPVTTTFVMLCTTQQPVPTSLPPRKIGLSSQVQTTALLMSSYHTGLVVFTLLLTSLWLTLCRCRLETELLWILDTR